MKRTIAAILALSPALLYGQAKTSAQPSSTPVLQASVQPAAFAAVKSSTPDVTASTPVRISTGVVPPQLIHTVTVDPDHILAEGAGGDRTVVIALTVNRDGKPENLKCIKSTDVFTDQGVLQAVSQFRFKPATLNNTPVPVTMKLAYNLQ